MARFLFPVAPNKTEYVSNSGCVGSLLRDRSTIDPPKTIRDDQRRCLAGCLVCSSYDATRVELRLMCEHP